MAAVTKNELESHLADVSSHNHLSPQLLPREKLEAIASALSLVSKFEMDYQDIAEEKLAILQEYCFSVLLGLCERNEWDSVKKIAAVVSGLTNLDGNTIFFNFIQEGDEPTCQKKLEDILKNNLAAALSNGTDKLALHAAMHVGRSDSFIHSLFELGCATDLQTDPKGRMLIHYAVKTGRPRLFESLAPKISGVAHYHIPYRSRKHQLDLCPVAIAIKKGHGTSLDELVRLRKMSLVTFRVGPENWTVFHWAIQMRQPHMVRHFLTQYLEHVRCLMDLPDARGRTPLILATQLGDSLSLLYLLQKGAQVAACDFRGRTALHHAAIKLNSSLSDILIGYGAKLAHQDFEGNTPSELIAPENKTFISYLTTQSKNNEYLKKQYPFNYYVNPAECIVFKGGGPKGVTFLGAVRSLENKGMFQHVKRFGGTSAGAITAAVLAMGFSSKEIENLLHSTPGTYFLDHALTEERLKVWISDNVGMQSLRAAYGTVSECITNASPMPLIKALGLNFVHRVWNSTGLFAGRRFIDWIEVEIAKRTGIHYCTFGELANLIAQETRNPQGRHFRHLHVFATKIGQDAKIERFSSEDFTDPETKNLIISEAIGASISIPIFFQSRNLVYKKKNAEGGYEFYTRHRTIRSPDYTAVVTALRTGQHKTEPSYIDGGLIYNFPVRAFDQSRYISGFTEQEENHEVINHRTLGFSLCSPPSDRAAKEESAETLGDVVAGVYHTFRHSESLLEEFASDKKREIELDNQGIGLFSFTTSPFKGKGKKAVEEAEKKITDFFELQEKEVKAFLTPKFIEQQSIPQVDTNGGSASNMIPQEISSEPSTELMLTSPIESPNDELFLQIGFMRTTIAEALGVGIIGPFFGVGKCIQMAADPIGFERDARWHYFRVLAHRNPQLQLFKHLREGSIPWVVNHFFEENRAFYMHPQFSQTVVPHLVFANDPSSISYLSEKTIPVNITLENGLPVAHHLVRYQCHHSFEALILAHDYQVDARDAEGNTILHRVAMCGGLVAYRILNKHQKIQPVLNARNSAQKTSILVAAALKHINLVKQLLAHDEIDVTGAHPKTLLHYLAEADEERAFFKLAQKAQEKGVLNELIAAENRLDDSILFTTENRKILRFLIENGIDVTKTQRGTHKTLLYILAKNDDLELMKLFNEKLKKNYPESRRAVINQQVNSSQLDSTTQEPRLKTALMIAAEKNNHRAVNFLIEEGADFRSVIDGRTPLDYAPTGRFRSESLDILQQAWRGNVKRPLDDLEKLEALSTCCYVGDFEAAKLLISNKILPSPILDLRDRDGNGLLLTVLKAKEFSLKQRRNIVQLLALGNHHDNANQADIHGQTPLMYARADAFTVKCLLQAGADPNQQDKNGKTVFHFAKDEEVIAILTREGGNPLLQDKAGKTPRDYATLANNVRLCKLLERCEQFYSQSTR